MSFESGNEDPIDISVPMSFESANEDPIEINPLKKKKWARSANYSPQEDEALGSVHPAYNPSFLACFLVGTVFFSHNKSANIIFQPAYQRSRTGS
jgi:hypothetical protein